MESITTYAGNRPGRSIWTIIAAGFAAIGAALVRSAENTGRMRRLERLRAMSDAELAKMGLRRDDIVRHVFRDLYYI